MANDLKISSSYDIRTNYVIRTESEWEEVFSEIKPNLGEIIVIGEKSGNTYIARSYIVGDGSTSFNSLERLDINTLHQGGGKTDTVKLANDIYFSKTVGYINAGTTINAGTNLDTLLQRMANGAAATEPTISNFSMVDSGTQLIQDDLGNKLQALIILSNGKQINGQSWPYINFSCDYYLINSKGDTIESGGIGVVNSSSITLTSSKYYNTPETYRFKITNIKISYGLDSNNTSEANISDKSSSGSVTIVYPHLIGYSSTEIVNSSSLSLNELNKFIPSNNHSFSVIVTDNISSLIIAIPNGSSYNKVSVSQSNPSAPVYNNENMSVLTSKYFNDETYKSFIYTPTSPWTTNQTFTITLSQ